MRAREAGVGVEGSAREEGGREESDSHMSRVAANATPLSLSARMGVFERHLSLWVALCILVGTGLGHAFPGVFATLGSAEVAKVKRQPKSRSEVIKKRNEIGDIVAKQLGNKRTQALKSYINPIIFDGISENDPSWSTGFTEQILGTPEES